MQNEATGDQYMRATILFAACTVDTRKLQFQIRWINHILWRKKKKKNMLMLLLLFQGWVSAGNSRPAHLLTPLMPPFSPEGRWAAPELRRNVDVLRSSGSSLVDVQNRNDSTSHPIPNGHLYKQQLIPWTKISQVGEAEQQHVEFKLSCFCANGMILEITRGGCVSLMRPHHALSSHSPCSQRLEKESEISSSPDTACWWKDEWH